MKKRFLLSLIFVIAISLSEVFSANLPYGISSRKIGSDYLIDFTLPAFEKINVQAEKNNFTHLFISSYGTVSDTGLPALPLVSFNVVIPASGDIPTIELLHKVTKDEIIENKIFPFQAPWPKNRPIDQRPFTYDKQYYQSNGKEFPFVQISEPFIINGVKGVNITLYPFNYNPLQNKLTYVQSSVFKIKLKEDVEVFSNKSSVMNNFLSDIFINYLYVQNRSEMNYLIITAPDYESGLTSFVNHKISIGYNVSVVNTETTGTTTTSIKNYIQQLYNNVSTRPEFVLLVGDVDKIPAFTGSGAGNPTTDLNYALLEGNDYFADVFVGRFSISNSTELQNVINKTIYMENYIGTLAKNNVFMASTDNYSITEGTHNYVINQYFNPAGYNNLKLYTYTYSATTTQLINALNSNKIFAIYSGHGGETSWADGPPLSQSQVRSLTNNVYPYVYSFACVTGSYHISECFGETWIRTTNGGSCFYGSSVNSYWDEDDILEKKLFKAMFEDDLTKVTPMMDKAKIYFVNHYGTSVSSGTTLLRYLEMYNLMGDPSLATKKLLVPDTTPPEPVVDLTAVNPTSNEINLNWTAPYDSTFGGIYGYDIRYSLSMINNDNDFNAASQIIFDRQNDSAGTPKTYKIKPLNFATTYYIAIKAYDLWGNKSPMSNVVSETTFGAPQIAVLPDSIHNYMPPQTIKIDTIFIHNISSHNSTLDYNVAFANNTFPTKISSQLIWIKNKNQSYNLENTKDNHSEIKGGNIKGHGGPDAFGYRWIDSDDPNGPAYVWNDIVSTGTQVTTWTATSSSTPLDDGYAGPFALGFNFKFYGTTKSQVYISTNGILHFGLVTSNIYTNAQIPNSSVPNDFIAPFWDDLDGRTQGTVHYKQETNKFTVQFTNWQVYSGTGSLTFQVVLYSNGKIVIYYKNMAATLNSATVGIENGTGTIGLQVAYNANYVKNNLALQFAAEPEWLTSTSHSGTLYNSNAAAVVLTFKSEDYPLGNYSMDMIVTSNDPNYPTLTIPIKMTIKYPVSLNLTALIEGLYDGSTMVRDTICLELRNSISPYGLVETKKIYLDTLGGARVNLNAPYESTPYYLVIKHRNSIETWSKTPQQFMGGPLSYDFTTSAAKAYGDNLKLKLGKYCIYSGEILNYDNYIDGDDVSSAFNIQGMSGYIQEDVTGDNFVDGDDVTVIYNNQGIGAIVPVGVKSTKPIYIIEEIRD